MPRNALLEAIAVIDREPFVGVLGVGRVTRLGHGTRIGFRIAGLLERAGVTPSRADQIDVVREALRRAAVGTEPLALRAVDAVFVLERPVRDGRARATTLRP